MYEIKQLERIPCNANTFYQISKQLEWTPLYCQHILQDLSLKYEINNLRWIPCNANTFYQISR